MRVGLGGHIHRSVFRKYPKNALSAQEAIAKMNPEYAGLAAIVRGQVPEKYRMTLAHECRYQGRRFVHVSLMDDAMDDAMDDSHTMSLVITRETSDESFTTEGALPALIQSGIPMYQAGVQRFQLTAFETPGYLVYFVSDLPKNQNTNLMLAIGPRVRDFLEAL